MINQYLIKKVMGKKEERYFELQEDAPLFKKLHDLYSSKDDNWWKKIINDKDLYVNVRNGNSIDVFYRAAGLINKLEYADNRLTCKIHKIYLGNEVEKKRKGEKRENGEDDYETKEGVETIRSEIVEQSSIIKKRIDNHYHKLHHVHQEGANEGKKKEPPEGMSEKEIQGDMYINPVKYGQQRYIDTEFVFVYDNKFKKDKDGNDTTHLSIRIDFVTITNDGLIEFVELKRISDNRLLTKEYKEKKEKCSKDGWPEICKQMEHYTDFIKKHQKQIVTYYKKVQTIMRNIGVNNPLANISIKGVKPEARLLFAPYRVGTEDRKGKKRERIECIKHLMESKHINSNISDVLDSLKKQPSK